jgi:hypothetical protein
MFAISRRATGGRLYRCRDGYHKDYHPLSWTRDLLDVAVRIWKDRAAAADDLEHIPGAELHELSEAEVLCVQLARLERLRLRLARAERGRENFHRYVARRLGLLSIELRLVQGLHLRRSHHELVPAA